MCRMLVKLLYGTKEQYLKMFKPEIHFLTFNSISFNLEFNRSRLCTSRFSSIDSDDGFGTFGRFNLVGGA